MTVLFCFVLFLLFSSFSEAQDPPLTGPLVPPATVTAAGSPIVLTWQDMSDNEVNFVVKRRTEPFTTWETIAYVHWNMTTYTDRQLVTGRYCYRVAAENFTGMSVDSNEVCVDFMSPPLPIPTLMLSTCCVTTTDPKGKAILSWTAPPAGVGIRIERLRQAPNMQWTYLVGPVAAEGVWYEQAVSLSVPWCWRASFIKIDERSALSNQVCSPS